MRKTTVTRDACFACTTPFQVVGAINIARSGCFPGGADIWLFDTFPNCGELAGNLRDLGLFDHVYEVDCGKISFFGKGKSAVSVQARAFIQEVLPGRYVKVEKGLAYNAFYSSSRAHVKTILLNELLKRNPEMKITVYDDGLGCYLEQSHVLRTSKRRQKAERLLGLKLFDPKKMNLMLYLPEIARLPEELRGCPVEEMPRLNWHGEEEKKLLKKIFGVSDAERYDEKVILFDNVRGAKGREEMFRGVDECFRVIVETAGYDNVVYKPHPRSVKEPEAEMKRVTSTGTPMEVLYAEMEDLSSRVLVAYNSTATYTPRMLFGEEPWVINLHRIVSSSLQEASETLYQTFLPTYRNRERLLAPGSMEELKEILERILRDLEDKHE